MKLNFFLYVIILGLVINLLANMIWKYLPGTDIHVDKVVTSILVFICIIFLIIYKDEEKNSGLYQQRVEVGSHSSGVHTNIGGTQIVAQGSVGIESLVNANRIEQLIINPKDSLEVKQQKIERAKSLIVHEILANIAAIDARLGYVDELVKRDTVEEKLRATRQKVAPSAQGAAASGYSRLIAENRISSLRQAMNSNPLRPEFGQPLIQVLIDAEVDVTPVRSFYDQLAEVQWATEALFTALSESTRDRADVSSWQDYYTRRLAFGIETLQQRSRGAYLFGLQALRTLGVIPDGIATTLAALKHLEPRQLPELAMIQTLLGKNVAQLTSLVTRKQTLQEEGSRLLEEDLRRYEQMNELLVIKPTDTWNEVVGKAISLRQLGRVTEALAAFHKYGQMFAASESTAAQYTATASAFTQQLTALGVPGGVYLFQILPQGAANEVDMAVGDIIIEYNGKTIAGMHDIVPALQDSREGEIVRVTYLRLDPTTGRFTRYSSSLKGGPLGAGIMPI